VCARPRSIEQADPKLPFKALDRLGQRRLRHSKANGGSAKMSVVGNSKEVPHALYVHITPI
jgi:hypothetical protein